MFGGKKVQAEYPPVIFCYMYSSGKQRLILPAGGYPDRIHHYSLFHKASFIFVFIIVKGAISYGRNKASRVQVIIKNGNIILIKINKEWKAQAIPSATFS